MKKVYQITGEGQEELMSWLEQPLADDEVQREFLIKLYLAGDLAPGQVLTLVTARRMQAEAMLQSLNADRDMADELRQVWMVDYALAMCRAEIDWLERIERQIDTVD